MPHSALTQPNQSQTVWALAWPSMMTYTAFALRQFTDTFMVSRLGTEPLAAIMPAQQVLFVIQSFGHGLASALNTCASQGEEKRGPKATGDYCWQSIWLALAAAAAAVQLTFVAPQIMGFFNHEFAVFEHEVAYFRLALWAIIPQFVAVALSNFFFAIRRPLIPMCFGIAHVAINIIANRILIFGLGPIEPMEIAGAAWGTIIASWCLVLGLMAYFVLAPSIAKFRPRFPTFHWNRIRDLLGIGPFNGAIDVVDILFWNLAILFFIGQFGTEHLAAAAIIVAILDLVVFPADGVIVALTTVVGHHCGAGRFGRAVRELRQSLWASLAFVGVGSAIAYLASPLIFQMMTSDPLVAQIGQRCFVVVPFILIFTVWFYVADSGLNGAGDARFPFFVILTANALIIIGGGFLCTRYLTEFGSYGVWVCVMINRGVIAVIVATRWASRAWVKYVVLDEQATA